LAIFPFFLSGRIGQDNVFGHILEREKGFVELKNKKSKKSKKWDFSKGVSLCLWSKTFNLFYYFIFVKVVQENVLDDVAERTLSRV